MLRRISQANPVRSLVVAVAATVLLLPGCTGPDRSADPLPSARGAGAAGSHSTSGSTSNTAARVSSTLHVRSVLPHRIRWEATPWGQAKVRQVDFLIDSQLAWTERNAPYVYGDDGNWLVTSFLAPGRHRFQTRLVTTDGQSAADTVVATVPVAHQPPMPVSGHWTRVVTAADTATATSGAPPPVGRWSLTIDRVGWSLSDPAQGQLRTDVAYSSPGRLVMRPTIEVPPFPNQGHGAFCREPDPEWAWTYAVRDHGRTLTLQPAGQDPCGDRLAVFRGDWTRTST